MSRELRVTLAIIGVALIMVAPALFAQPAAVPANYNYLAAVFHIVVTTPTVTPCHDAQDICDSDATDAAIDAMTATADSLTATALATLTKTPVPPVGTKVLPAPTTTPTPRR